MNLLKFLETLTAGLSNTFILSVVAVLVPLLVGVGFTILNHFTKRTPVPKIMRYVHLPFECLAPIACLGVIYFVVGAELNLSAFAALVITFSICYWGYMVVRYNPADSLAKNIAVNGIGLIASVFKWSMISSFVGYMDLFRSANLMFGRTYDSSVMIIPLLISIGVLALLYVAKNLCKDLMK